ncbi:MAG: response regulator [Acidobacteria bacterium]|nr:response regulator [Acidobacteriota bacterium]
MVPAALLVSRDTAVLDLMQRLLEDEGIRAEVSSDVSQACDLLDTRKFDAVIVDCDDMLAVEVLLRLRSAPSSRRAVAFALLNGVTSHEAAFALGANFALEKPLSPQTAARNVRAARGLIVQERRRYYRHPVDLSAALTLPGGSRLYVRTTNLSQDGIGVELLSVVQTGTRLQITFELPEQDTEIEAVGEVAWCRGGNAGIRFQEILPQSRTRFRRWMEKNTPDGEEPRPGVFVSATRHSA